MGKKIEFNTLHKMPLGFIKNHPACEVRIGIGDMIVTTSFVIDTGADITMLPFNLVRRLSMDKYTVVENYDCGGVGGSLLGSIVEATILSVANYSAVKPYIFIPHDRNWSIPILGFDMLRGIYPFIDTKERAVWFTRIKDAGATQIPSINLELKCDVLIAGER
jgi:hypothetical protein